MRIISKFKDYYDLSMKEGIDESLIYVRNIEPLDINNIIDTKDFYYYNYTPLPRNKLYLNAMSPVNNISCSILGFCGNYYPIVKLTMNEDTKVYCYSYKEYIDNLKKYIKNYTNIYKHSYGMSYKNPESNKIINLFNNTKSLIKTNIDLFHEYKTPIIYIDIVKSKDNYYTTEVMINKNIKLSELDFYKIYDSYTAYQEISMFFGGIISRKENNIVQIEDKYILQQKGFDKYSFKKLPSKHI